MIDNPIEYCKEEYAKMMYYDENKNKVGSEEQQQLPEGETGEEGLDGEEDMGDDSLDDEQQDNTENDPQSQQNKYLAHDFIELYNRQKEIIDKIKIAKL